LTPDFFTELNLLLLLLLLLLLAAVVFLRALLNIFMQPYPP